MIGGGDVDLLLFARSCSGKADPGMLMFSGRFLGGRWLTPLANTTAAASLFCCSSSSLCRICSAASSSASMLLPGWPMLCCVLLKVKTLEG